MSPSIHHEVVGVAPPPPGVTPNFVNPPSIGHYLVIVNIVCTIISLVFVILRLYTECAVTQNVGTVDYVVAFSWLLALGASITSSLLVRYGQGRHIWDVDFSIFNINYQKAGAVSGTFYGISIMLTKVAILMWYLRFTRSKQIRMFIYTTMVIVVLYSLSATFEWLYACRPIAKLWDFTITHGSCINFQAIYIFSGAMNTATDLTILLLPTAILRNLRLPRRQKIGVYCIFMTGGFVLVISILRLKWTVDMMNDPDLTWRSTITGLWWMVEMHVAIICACLPAGKPFLRRHFPKVIGSSYATPIPSKKQSFPSSHFRRVPSSQRMPPREEDEIKLSGLSVHCRDVESNRSQEEIVNGILPAPETAAKAEL